MRPTLLSKATPLHQGGEVHKPSPAGSYTLPPSFFYLAIGSSNGIPSIQAQGTQAVETIREERQAVLAVLRDPPLQLISQFNAVNNTLGSDTRLTFDERLAMLREQVLVCVSSPLYSYTHTKGALLLEKSLKLIRTQNMAANPNTQRITVVDMTRNEATWLARLLRMSRFETIRNASSIYDWLVENVPLQGGQRRGLYNRVLRAYEEAQSHLERVLQEPASSFLPDSDLVQIGSFEGSPEG